LGGATRFNFEQLLARNQDGTAMTRHITRMEIEDAGRHSGKYAYRQMEQRLEALGRRLR